MGRELSRCRAQRARRSGLAGLIGLAAALLWPALAVTAGPAASAGPKYVVEPCCQLCPQADNRALYTTRMLESVTTLVQARDGWLFRTDDDLRSTFGPDETGYADLKRFRDALHARGVDLVMVYQPTRGLMHSDKLPPEVRKLYNLQLARFSYGATLERFRKLGITVPPLDHIVNENSPQGYFFRGDHHWTPAGSQRTAHVVAEAIRGMPSFKGIPQKKFVTERTINWGKRGTLQRAATQLCGFGYADQFVPRYVTTASEGGGDLLDDAAVPQITLAGTSNSDAPYNFSGFLEQELGVDILNEAVTGGGHEGALEQYLPSEAFQKTPPKILIWELETYHNLSKTLFYRQVIPLVTNGCATRPTVMSRKVTLKSGSTEALFNGGGKVIPMRSADHMLDVKFSDPNVRDFKAVVWYTNGSKETISIEHSAYIETGGRFVVELRDDPGWSDRMFLSMDVLTPEGIAPGTTLTSTVCTRAAATPPQPPKAKTKRAPMRGHLTGT